MQHHDHGNHVTVVAYKHFGIFDVRNRHVEQYVLDDGAHVIILHPRDHDLHDVPAALAELALDLIGQCSADTLAGAIIDAALADVFGGAFADAFIADVPGVAQLHEAVGGDAEQWDPELEPGYRPGGGSANDPDGDDGRRNGD